MPIALTMPTANLLHRLVLGLLLPFAACQLGPDVPSANPSQPTSSGSKLALVVGVATYEHLSKLEYPDRDAEDMARELAACGFAVEHLRARDGAAIGLRRDEVLQAVDRLARGATPDSTLLVYFNGHGFGDADGNSYIAAADLNPDQLPATAIGVEQVRATLLAAAARNVVLIIDAPRNIPGGGDLRADLPAAAPRSGSFLLHAAAPGGLAFEPPAGTKDADGNPIQNACFTHFLLRGLRGEADRPPAADGVITVRELAQFVTDVMAAQPDRSMGQQKPTSVWDQAAADVVLRESVLRQRPAN